MKKSSKREIRKLARSLDLSDVLTIDHQRGKLKDSTYHALMQAITQQKIDRVLKGKKGEGKCHI